MRINFFLFFYLGSHLILSSSQLKMLLPLRIRRPIPDFRLQDMNICSFGASVTQQKDSIWDHFVEELNKVTGRKHKHIKMGYGGEHLYPTASCHIDDVIGQRPNICILDWFDTGYKEISKSTKKSIENLIRKLSEINSYIILFYHIRGDMDETRANFIDFVDRICHHYQISSYHEKDALQQYVEIHLNDILRDVVHTTSYGSQFLGKIFCDYFCKIPIKNKINSVNLPPKNNLYEVEKIKINSEMIQGSFYVDEDGYYVFGKKASLNMNLNNKHFLGIRVKKGPYAPVIKVIIDGHTTLIYSIWDRWCYYERTSVEGIIDSSPRSINIMISEIEPAYKESGFGEDNLVFNVEKKVKIKEFFVCPDK